MKPPHKHFFSSLKQLEKRLKLDDGNPPPPPPPESSTSSPIYFHNHQTNTSSTPHNNSIEQPPQEFLSINDTNDFQSNPNKSPNKLPNPEINLFENDAVGGIESMIRLLRLSEFDGRVAEMPDVADDEFYDNIVKAKGPKCKKEVERLDSWINYYLLSDGGREVLRLTHLLIAKAAIVVGGGDGDGDGDGDGLEFPSTVDEFLQNDPPSD